MMADYLRAPIGPGGGREIGTGGSSRVRLVRDPATGKTIAVKYFSGPNLDRNGFIREVNFLAALNHPCVLRIIGWAFPEGSSCGEVHTEFAEQGSLADVLIRRQMESGGAFWTATRMAIVICDIVLGMRFVHLKRIIHRDLKPSNVLIQGNGRALIGDFGSSRLASDDATLTEQSGTVHYAAPELFDEFGELTDKVDVWAFGLILYEIVTGPAVFPLSLQPFEVIRKMRRRDRPMIPEECGQYMEGLIGRCWSEDASTRPSFEEILGEFRSRQFAILPGVDCREIAGAVEGVLLWELDARVRRSWA
jgi:abelson tyrosine-protein kinase 1